MTELPDFEGLFNSALSDEEMRQGKEVARILKELITGTVSHQEALDKLTDSRLLEVLSKIAGEKVRQDSAIIIFGSGGSFGDVTIQDVAGGNIIKLSIPIHIHINSGIKTASDISQEKFEVRERRLSIFLCHSSKDRAMVDQLYRRLCVEGFEPWFANNSLLPGETWDYKIRRVIEEVDVFIICLTRGSITGDGYIEEELRFALNIAERKPVDERFIIPVRLEQCEVPARLQRWQWVDCYNEINRNRLIRALHRREEELRLLPPPASTTHLIKEVNFKGGFLIRKAAQGLISFILFILAISTTTQTIDNSSLLFFLQCTACLWMPLLMFFTLSAITQVYKLIGIQLRFYGDRIEYNRFAQKITFHRQDDITIQENWIYVLERSMRGYRFKGFELRRFDGLTVMLDPALSEHFDLRTEFSNYFLPHYIKRFNIGQSIGFGQIIVSRKELVVGAKIYPWKDIEGIRFGEGIIELSKENEDYEEIAKISDVPNATLLRFFFPYILENYRNGGF